MSAALVAPFGLRVAVVRRIPEPSGQPVRMFGGTVAMGRIFVVTPSAGELRGSSA